MTELRTRPRFWYAIPLLIFVLLLLGSRSVAAGSLPLLSHGDRGGTVVEAQRLLQAGGVYPGPQDGIFGPRTERAVRTFQRNHGLANDGIIGPHTWRALDRARALVTRSRAAGGGVYGWPTHLRGLSSRFGPRAVPCSGCSDFHMGIDFPGPVGVPVHAARDGRVAFAGWARGYGNVIYIDHGGKQQTRYAHLNAVWVKAGQTVRRDQVIGALGNTGTGTGPHLHFELRLSGQAVNPLSHLQS